MATTRRTSLITDVVLLGLRGVVGGYVAGHGAQKLFGAFDGPGLDVAGDHFEQNLGLAPGRPMAALAAGTELVGGGLTALGLASPLGPMAIAGTMAVATETAHRGNGPFTASGGPELALTNLASAAVIATVGPGRFSLDRLLRTNVRKTTVALALAAGAAVGAFAISQKRIAELQAEEPAPVDAPTTAPSELRRTA